MATFAALLRLVALLAVLPDLLDLAAFCCCALADKEALADFPELREGCAAFAPLTAANAIEAAIQINESAD